MLQAATIGLLLSLAPQAAPPAGKTLWVVQPLYPGQEMLVTRTEEALRRMMPGDQDQVVGSKALSEHMAGRKPDLRCFTGDVSCADPVDAFVGGLGFDRVVMLKGGQEDSAYRYKVTSYVPATSESLFAENAGANLERALMGALVKVVPLASTLEVESTPPGATVFVDGEKVGVTPYSGQVLPGERVIKVETASHMPFEKKVEVPVRGKVSFKEGLEKVPARIVVLAKPEGTSISVDGAKLGVDKVDKPIQPGRHKVEFALEGYEPHSEDVEIKPGDTLTLERELSATGWTSFKAALSRAQEPIYKRSSSFGLNYEFVEWHGDALYAQKNPTKSVDDKEYLLGRQLLTRSNLHGLSLEYSQDGRYFGLMVVGAAYLTGSDWTYTLENGTLPESTRTSTPHYFELRALQPHLRIAFWRFMLYGQAGVTARGLFLPAGNAPNEDDLWVVDALLNLEVRLRAYLVEGLFLEGGYRYSWALFSNPAHVRGFHGGIGYAF